METGFTWTQHKEQESEAELFRANWKRAFGMLIFGTGLLFIMAFLSLLFRL
ncbi:MAG: hypothetical protein H6Q65_2235 [Firmicutes bacterium]|nr:hypothetical protein [Bacillota bacterium]